MLRRGDNRDLLESMGTFRDRLEDGHAFSTNRQPVSRIFNVAPGENAPVPSRKRRAHLESGKGGMRPFPRFPGQLDKFLDCN